MTKIVTLAHCAVLCVLEVSQWSARKKDKKVEGELQATKGAGSRRAASVHKHLFADCQELAAIAAYAADTRLWFNSVTLPWDDRGTRIVPSLKYLDVMAELSSRIEQFDKLVAKFVNVYTTEISKQAFSLGDMFDRSEYPSVQEVSLRFGMRANTYPVPTAGDFRVDIGEQIGQELAETFQKDADARVEMAMKDAWMRLKDKVEHIRGRMTAVLEFDPNAPPEVEEGEDDTDGVTLKKARKPKLYASMLDSAMELCATLKDLNVMNDPELEQARCDLLASLRHVDIDSLKKSEELQASTKSKMDALLAKMPW